MNFLDFSILHLSLMEYLLIGENFLLIFRYIRFLTAFKVFRLTRLFKEIKYLSFLFSIISSSLSSFIYLALLFLLVNFVYALVGMQLFGGFLNKNDPDYNTFNFDTFWVAFLTVFDIVTLDNWITILKLLYHSEMKIISSLYVISWIFLGNFALLNLFLAILLDGFTQSLEEEDKIKIIDEEHKDIEKEEIIENIIGNQELQIVIPKDAREAFVDELTKEYLKYTKIEPNNGNNMKKDTHLLEDLIEETQKTQGKNEKEMFESRCETAFFVFSKENNLRILANKVLQSKNFRAFIIIMLVFSCFIILLETYFDKKSEDYYEKTFSLLIRITNLILTLIFIAEILIKSMVHGFCFEKKSFVRSLSNVLDAWIVFSYIVDFVYFEEDFGFNISSVFFDFFDYFLIFLIFFLIFFSIFF